jgi:hypothetical protein
VFGVIEGHESIMSSNLRKSRDIFSKKGGSRIRESIAGKFLKKKIDGSSSENITLSEVRNGTFSEVHTISEVQEKLITPS